MARFGQGLIQGLLNPTFGNNLNQVGQSVGAGLGQAPLQLRDNLQAQRNAEGNRMLSQVGSEITAGAQNARMQGDQRTRENETVQGLSKIARKEKVEKQKQAQDRGEGELMALAADPEFNPRDKKQLQGFLSMADSYGVPRNKAMQIAREAATSPKTDIVTEEVMVDGKPSQVSVTIDKNTGKEIGRVNIGQAPREAPKETPKSLTQQLKENGFEADLTTVSGAKAARDFVITNLQNASLANSIDNIVEDLTPMGSGETLGLVRQLDPAFAAAEDDLILVNKFKGLTSLADQDVAGLSALIERTITAATQNDVKAASELNRFRGASSIPQRLTDFLTLATSGNLSQDTVKEYSQIMEIIEAVARTKQSNVIDRLTLYGSPKEQEAAERARDLLGLEGARIVDGG